MMQSRISMMDNLRRFHTRLSSSYVKTLNAPVFPITIHKDTEKHEHFIKQWDEFFARQSVTAGSRDTREKFLLHDGPPYANGAPHVGHALNKILKDIIVRRQVLEGRRVLFRPGWDCHGLPIEMKALGIDGGGAASPTEVRRAAGVVAKKFIEVQRSGFRSWGVLGDWKNPYLTMDRRYEARQIRAFGELLQKGFVERDLWPVHWSYATKTALAEAELEYNEEHVSPSVFVRFRLRQRSAAVSGFTGDSPCYVVIWTTTPWTLPGNKAVAFSTDLDYVLLRDGKEFYIVGAAMKTALEQFLHRSLTPVTSFKGSALEGATFVHPIFEPRSGPLLPAAFVTDEKGTGLVHIAPAHGRDDFRLASDHGLRLESLVNEDARYSPAASRDLEGLHILDEGNDVVIAMLEANGSLVHREKLIHSYPYDWRSKTPVIMRASEQWFINTDRLAHDAMAAYEPVRVLPEAMRSSMLRFVADRPRWCISRQRYWGVPIPVFFDAGRPVLHKKIVDLVAQRVEVEGCDFWFREDAADILPQEMASELGVASVAELRKGTDIFDIWFDSGLSWLCALEDGEVADVYLEGQDQFRGWFSSSLLLSAALRGRAPYRALLVHGFTTDEAGRKMSKSLGNVVDPAQVVTAHGPDELRYWAASAGLASRSEIGANLMAHFEGKVKALRNMFRFALGNLSDFPPAAAVPWAALPLLDRHLLCEAALCRRAAAAAYNAHRFDQALAAFEAFSSVLSNFYFTAVKDRLYCAPEDSPERRAAQTAIHGCLRLVLPQMAPVLPFLAEEVFSAAPRDCPPELCLLEAAARGLWSADCEAWRLDGREQRAMELALRVREAAGGWAAGRGKKSAAGARLAVRPEAAEVEALVRLAHPEGGPSALREAARCAEVELLPRDAAGPDGADFLPLDTPAGRCGLFLQLRPKSFTCARCRLATKLREEEQLCRRCAEVLAAA